MSFYFKKSIVAPMAGISDTVFRLLCKKMGADIVFSEMVSADGLIKNPKREPPELLFSEKERPICIQIFGSDPGLCSEAVKIIQDRYAPDCINLNAGCPVPKIVRKNGGAALLKDELLFGRIVEAMVKAVDIPITVKIRSGWTTGQWVDTRFAVIAQESGAQAIIVHPRSKAMAFSGHSFWERISEVKQTVSIPVIGNGDIVRPEDAAAMYNQTGCDSIMVGRATYGNPWIFRGIKENLENREISPVERAERYAIAQFHLAEYCRIHGEKKARNEMKKHIAWYLRGLPKTAHLRGKLASVKSIHDLEELLKQGFEENQ